MHSRTLAACNVYQSPAFSTMPISQEKHVEFMKRAIALSRESGIAEKTGADLFRGQGVCKVKRRVAS